jgi:hypothetical protein
MHDDFSIILNFLHEVCFWLNSLVQRTRATKQKERIVRGVGKEDGLWQMGSRDEFQANGLDTT